MTQNKILDIQKNIKSLNRLSQIIYPIMPEKRILTLTLQKTRIAMSRCINLILYLEKVELSKNPKKNLDVFFNYCAPKYKISKKDSIKIKELFLLAKKQRESAMDFKRDKKIIILGGNLEHELLSIEKMKGSIMLLQKIFENTICQIF